MVSNEALSLARCNFESLLMSPSHSNPSALSENIPSSLPSSSCARIAAFQFLCSLASAESTKSSVTTLALVCTSSTEMMGVEMPEVVNSVIRSAMKG